MKITENTILNFIDKEPQCLVDFLLTYEKISVQETKELQKCLLQRFSERHLGDKNVLELYYKKAIKNENIHEGNLCFDARFIHTTRDQLKKALYTLGSESSTISENTFLSGIETEGGITTFSLLHMKDKKSIGVFAVDDIILNNLPENKKDRVIHLLQKRSDLGNHDRFHNISFDTIEKVLKKEDIVPLEEIIREELSSRRRKYPIVLKLQMKSELFKKIYQQISLPQKNPKDDLYVKTRKLYDNLITPKRKKINIPETMGGGRKKRNSMMSGIAAETRLYEYLSILIHFRVLQEVYNHHPEVKEKIIQESQEYISTVQELDIDQKHKDYWIGNYLLFTSRIINLEDTKIEDLISELPITGHDGIVDFYAINNALIEDNKRMDKGFTVT